MLKRVHIVIISVALSIAGIALTFNELIRPIVLYNSEGRYVPRKWSQHFSRVETLYEMRAALGRPTVDESAKDVNTWTIDYPWGQKSFVLIGDYQHMDKPPSLIIYTVKLKKRPFFGLGSDEIYNVFVGGKDAKQGEEFRKYPFISNPLVVSK